MPPAYEFRGNRHNRPNGRSRPQHEFTFRARYPKTASRPLLMSKKETTPEFLGGSKEDEANAKTFMPLDNITDSDEAEMDVSSADEESSQPPRKKQAVESPSGPAPAAPKWSNPDPYTVLPPPDESQSRKVDVVKLIRKARLQPSQPKTEEKNAVASNDDFISFGTEGLGDEAPPEGAPRGPRRYIDQDGDPALGNRKRTYDDEIIGPRQAGRPEKPEKYRYDGSILSRWLPLPEQNPSPWIDTPTSTPLHLGSL